LNQIRCPHTEETKSKISQSHIGKIKEMSLKVLEYNKVELTCPHCGKTGRGIGIMNRWHFDNCKKKEM